MFLLVIPFKKNFSNFNQFDTKKQLFVNKILKINKNVLK
jgi:hypothetical protein